MFPAVSAGDSEGGGASAFGAAFAGFPAPFGEGGLPAGIGTSNIPGPSGPVRPGARTHYAFDSTGPTGTVRVIVIDNSRGSLAASDPYQNPAEPQAPWLGEMLADARARGIPAIVVGSRELNPGLPPALNVATDASEEAQIMVAGGASAYLYERPEESRASQIPAGGAATIPEYGTGALGYRSAISGSFTPGQPDALFGATGYLLVSVNVAQRNPATNVAPVSARLIPLVQSLSLDPLDGTLLRRSAPALFEGLARRPVSGDRWGPASADRQSQPARRQPLQRIPPGTVPAIGLLQPGRTGIHLHLLRTGNRQLRRAGPQLDEPAQAPAGVRRACDSRPQVGHPVRVQRRHDGRDDLRRGPVLFRPGDGAGRQRRAALRHRAAGREPLRQTCLGRLGGRRFASSAGPCAGPGADRAAARAPRS